MRFFSNFYLQQGLYAVGHALSVLLGLSPFDIWPCAFSAVFFLLAAAHQLVSREKKLWHLIYSWAVFSLALTCITFPWIITTLHRYTGEQVLTSGLLSLGYAAISQIKISAVFLAVKYLFREGFLMNGLPVAAVIALADALTPEVFPWAWGNALSGQPYFRQLAAVGSVYLVSFACGVGGYIVVLLKMRYFDAFVMAGNKNLFTSVGLFLIMGVSGAALYYQSPPDARNIKNISVLIIQTNIGAAADNRRTDVAFATDAINRLVNQSAEGLILHDDTDIIIWPEASMPFHSTEKQGESAALYSVTFDAMLDYIKGKSYRSIIYHDMIKRSDKLYSRLAVRGSSAQYLKRRLVPWGEYLPFEEKFPSLRKIFLNAGQFAAGPAANEIDISYGSAETDAIKIKPLICYEALYPNDSRISAAELIINLSSDAWFGDGLEGGQHSGAAMLRAVENGVPMVRAAMSGITSAVDFRGDTIGRKSEQGRVENIFIRLPLERRQTLFQKWGLTPFYIFMAFVLLPLVLYWFRSFRTRENK